MLERGAGATTDFPHSSHKPAGAESSADCAGRGRAGGAGGQDKAFLFPPDRSLSLAVGSEYECVIRALRKKGPVARSMQWVTRSANAALSVASLPATINSPLFH